jgi:hypothetical protein
MLGGVAKAAFAELPDQASLNTAPGTSLDVQWQEVFFIGYDPVIGPVQVELQQPGAAGAAISTVQAVAESDTIGTRSFFPARNVNRFWFEIQAPRFGVAYRSSGVLENEATITSIPPWKTVYTLRNGPIRFQRTAQRRSLLSYVAAPEIQIEECRVKLMELENIDVDLSFVRRKGDFVTFQAVVTNKSTEENVGISWIVWPRPEETHDQSAGVARIGRQSIDIEITLSRDIFYKERWLAIAVTEPFETDAAFAGLFPNIP